MVVNICWGPGRVLALPDLGNRGWGSRRHQKPKGQLGGAHEIRKKLIGG